ncbi:hypothetical protein C1N62_22955 (plasmid) [Nissabacter sp. SGAir0207]|nr:helix-turn-helix transcriptional regulator [Nissabacter sp. SGAir0207]QCR38974.1 hypothetical protein C1N62_22955 [Nissabacter sp. SGAir0207]
MKRGTWLQARREELKNTNPDNSGAFTLRGVAQRLGVTHAALSHLEKTDAMPSLEMGVNLADYYGKTPRWVLTGKDTFVETGIPIVGTTKTGPGLEFIRNGLKKRKIYEFIDMPAAEDRKLYALCIEDDCASAAYRQGDYLILDAASQVKQGEDHLVVFRKDDDQDRFAVSRDDDTFVSILTMITEKDGKITFASVTKLHGRSIVKTSEILHMHPVFCVAKASAVKSSG